MEKQPSSQQEAEAMQLAPDLQPATRRWIVRKYGLKVLAEVGRLRTDAQYAATDVRNLVPIAYETVWATEIRSREAAASLPCDSSAIRHFAEPDVE